MNRYLLYYYTDNFQHRRYCYIYANTLGEAWRIAKNRYGLENLESLSFEPKHK